MKTKTAFLAAVAAIGLTAQGAGLGVNTAIVNLLSDSHFTDIIMVNYTYGIQTWGGCNRFTRCHFWGWKDRVRKSVAFDVWGGDIILSECYADTAETGFWIRGDATMSNCTSCNHPDCPMENPVAIRHDAGSLIVTASRFMEKEGEKKPALYVRGEKAGEIVWRDSFQGDRLVAPEALRRRRAREDMGSMGIRRHEMAHHLP